MHAKSNITEEEIIVLFFNKDVAAIDVIYEKYGSALYGVVVRIVRSEEIAADVLQDSFVKIWKNMHTYDSKKGRLFTWLLNIARNTAIDVVRSKRFKSVQNYEQIEEVHHKNPSESTEVKVDHIGMKDLVNTLKEDHKKIIELLYFSGYTQAEVSEELDIPLGTVKTRTRSAMKQLRNIFGA